MIKDKLMVGNWILDPQGEPLLMTEKELAFYLTNDFQQLGCDPILLTPEILQKCGFTSLPHFTVMDSRILDVGRGRKLSIGCVGTPNEMLFITDEEDGKTDNIIVLHNWDYDGPLYLHKLQNIISIFNTELTINL